MFCWIQAPLELRQSLGRLSGITRRGEGGYQYQAVHRSGRPNRKQADSLIQSDDDDIVPGYFLVLSLALSQTTLICF